MSVFSCLTCGAQFTESDQPPPTCLICSDERQYVRQEGQKWATRQELIDEGYRNVMQEVEPGVYSVGVEPKLGIGQQAYFIQTQQGNVLWDCVGLLHTDFIEQAQRLGGIKAIAISHPHFYTACADWAEAFGCKVFLPEADKEWVTRPSPHIQFWDGDAMELLPGVELIRLGGHFPGSSVLLWRGGCEGRGALFTGDTLFPVPDRGWVSFMLSFPNLVPLPAEQVARIGRRLEQYSFDRLYGPFPGSTIQQGAAEAVQRSVERYCGVLSGSLQSRYY